ncbi:Ribokinase-like protein [Whalleya microplaca]|nr:Ribokinase-like protein [Whalleya microplaca]
MDDMTAEVSQATGIRFVSLGMVVLDEIRLPNGEIFHDVIGGSGTYSTLGARLVTHPSKALEVGCFIRAGYDFPDKIKDLFRSWGIRIEINVDEARKSTRGLLEYHDDLLNRKSFRYTTVPLQPEPRDLSPSLLLSGSFHMLLPPETLVAQVKDLRDLRQKCQIQQSLSIIWEPLPGKCTKEFLEAHRQACNSVNIFSPNHLELLSLFGVAVADFDRSQIEKYAKELLGPGIGSYLEAIVVRAGEHGCLVVDRSSITWLPPFFQGGDHIVDTTGAGNTFLGAFAMVLERSGNLLEAAIQATVAASFSIEQVGLAKRTATTEAGELWNNSSVTQRFGDYRDRISKEGYSSP